MVTYRKGQGGSEKETGMCPMTSAHVNEEKALPFPTFVVGWQTSSVCLYLCLH